MTRFLYDTAVFIYAVGAEHPSREPCRSIVTRAQRGELRGEASVDLVQEFLDQRARKLGDRAEAATLAAQVAELCLLHAPDARDAATALNLFSRHATLGARDAFFAAVALNRGIEVILSPDHDFDGIPGLRRVDPADYDAVAALAGERRRPR